MRHFFYDRDKIIAEREGNSWVVRHLLGLMPVGFEVEGSVRIYHSDRLGGVRYVTDASQNTLVSYVMKGLAWWWDRTELGADLINSVAYLATETTMTLACSMSGQGIMRLR